MFKTCLENRIAAWKSGYKCYLCHTEIQDNNFTVIEKHIETKKHQESLSKIDEATRLVESQKLNTISEAQRRKIVRNQITNDIKPCVLYCHVCKCSISGISNTLEHIKGYCHESMYNKIETNNKQNEKMPISSSKNQEINAQKTNLVAPMKHNNLSKNDCVTFNATTGLWKCTVCNVDISGSSSTVLEHTQSSFHRSIAAALDNKTINVVLNNKSIDGSVNVSTNSQDHFIKILFCMPCQVHLKNTTMLQFHNMIHLHEEIGNDLWNTDIINCQLKENKPSAVKCLLCNIVIPDDENFYKHFCSPLHLNYLEFYRYVNDDIPLDNVQLDMNILKKLKFKSYHISKALLCALCDAPVSTAAGKSSHEKGKRHQKNALQYCQDKTQKISNQSIPDSPNFYACYICQKSFFNTTQLFNHYKEMDHRVKMTCFNFINKNVYITFDTVHGQLIEAMCTLCQTHMGTCRATIDHILGKKHRGAEEASNLSTNLQNLNLDKSQNINNNKILTLKTKIAPINPSIPASSSITKNKNEFETTTEELLKLGFSPDNINFGKSFDSNSLDVDGILNELIPLTLTNSQQKKLSKTSIKRKPRLPNSEGKKTISSFHQNVYIWGKSYINYCINSGTQNIYNINPKKFHLLKLGTSLIFPWQSEKACIVCGVQLTNEQIVFEHLQDDKHIEKLLEMEENNKEFKDYIDQFSDLKLAINYIQEESNDWVYCYACESKVKDDDTYICLHIGESNHINKSQEWRKISDQMYEKFSAFFKEAWYYSENFICDVCKIKRDMEIDFIMHLETREHFEKVEKFLKTGNIARFGMCPTCITYWYASTEFYNIHCKDHFHKHLAKNGSFKVPNMTNTALDLINNVDDQIKLLRNESNRAVLEKHKETELLKTIEETVETLYPNAKAYTFGSRLSQLGFVDSDVDVFLDCDNLYYRGATQEQSQRYLMSVKKNFETQPNIWIVDEVLLVTRVPILKLRHIPTGLKCDISFINGLSVEKSALIGFYNAAYPICRELILYLKRWLSLCRITGSDCITTFAISWYVIFYLQINKVLPSVYDLIQLKRESKIIDGWECGFVDNFSANHSDLNFREQLKGFFNYYAQFDYKEDVACPYLGEIIKKHTFADIDKLPAKMLIYKRRIQRDYLQTFRFDSPMCIQDPIDLSQNITKAVKKHHLRCFRQYCTETAAKC